MIQLLSPGTGNGQTNPERNPAWRGLLGFPWNRRPHLSIILVGDNLKYAYVRRKIKAAAAVGGSILAVLVADNVFWFYFKSQ